MHDLNRPAGAPGARESSTVSRRDLLKRTAAAGLGAASISILADYTAQSIAHAAAIPLNLWETIPTDTEKFWISTLLPKFAAMHPECRIVPRQLGAENAALIRAGLKAGGSKAPDMAWLNHGETGAYVQANLLPDVQGWLDKHPAIKNNIIPSLNRLATFQGKIWSLPWVTNNCCMLINVDAFNKAGVPIPSQDPARTWTWEQFAGACARLTRGGMKGFLITTGSTVWEPWVFHAWLAQAGGVFLQDDGTAGFNSAAGVEAMTFLRTLVTRGYTAFSESGKGYDPAPFFAGKVAIEINGPWNFSGYSTLKDFKMTAVPYPRHKQIATNVGGDQLFIFDHGAVKNACSFAYGAYMLSDEFQIAFQINSGALPVTQTAVGSKAYQDHLRRYPILNGWVNGVPYSVAQSNLPQSTEVQALFSHAWDDILLKGADIKGRLDQAAQQAAALKGQ